MAEKDIRDILNRRVAIDVMGEDEPAIPTRSKPSKYTDWGGTDYLAPSNDGWHVWLRGRRMRGEDEYEWVPHKFSEDMNLAMKAAAKVLERIPNSKLEVWVDDSGYWNARIPGCVGAPGRSKNPAEAICHMLTFPITLDRAGMGP